MAIGITIQEARDKGLSYEDAYASARTPQQRAETDAAYGRVGVEEMNTIDQQAAALPQFGSMDSALEIPSLPTEDPALATEESTLPTEEVNPRRSNLDRGAQTSSFFTANNPALSTEPSTRRTNLDRGKQIEEEVPVNQTLSWDDIDNDISLQDMNARDGDELTPEGKLIQKDKILTLAEIANDTRLRELNAAPGDVVSIDNRLIRKYSTEDSNLEGSITLTQEEIDGSPELQAAGAQAGDTFTANNDLIPEKTSSAWEQFNYSIDNAGNIATRGTDILKSYFPLGGIAGDFSGFVSADEIYGEGFTDAVPEQRREMIMRKKERDLQNEYGQFFQEKDGAVNVAGTVVKALADPTNLIPLGQGYKTMAASSAALGALYEVTSDVAQNKEIDYQKMTTTALAAGVLTPAMVKAARTVASKVVDRGANKLVDKSQVVINRGIADGSGPPQVKMLLEEAGINPLQVKVALDRTGRKLTIPMNTVQAERAIAASIANDSAMARNYSPAIDKYLGIWSTRVKNISEPIFGRMRRFEFNTHAKTHYALKKVEPFMVGLSRLEKPIKARLAGYLFNGNFKSARKLMEDRSPEMLDSFEATVTAIKDMGAALKAAGHNIDLEAGEYFPRMVKDYDGLRAALGKSELGVIDRALGAYAAKRNKANVDDLTDIERATAIDLTMRGYRLDTTGANPRFIKPRTIKYVPPELQKFYAQPEESLSMYMRGSVDNIEKRALFGMDNVRSVGNVIDAESSIGHFLNKELAEGNITKKQQEDLQELMHSRFIEGAKSPSDLVGAVRDLGYMGTIANPVSALTSLADVANSGALKGLRNTIAAMFGTKEMKLIDLGLGDTVMAELAGDTRATAIALNKMMKYTGFQTIDRLGKETYINAALKKARQMVKSEKGTAAFKKRAGQTYGSELDDLVGDLKAGNMTENVKLFLFNELSDIQPITLSEMPQGYLNQPNWRILYMLKSFTLKQWDILRRESVQEWKKGNKLLAVKNAALLGGYLAGANVSVATMKDILLGREVKPENLEGDAMWALLGVFGLNRYTNERYLARGDVKGAIVNTLLPATPLMDATLNLGAAVMSDERGGGDYGKVMKGIPMIGPIAYSYLGGGLERWEDQEKARERAKRRDDR